MRAKLNQSWPRAGVPPAFASWRELAEFAVWARDGGAIPGPSHQWWDLRLSATHGTIEVRVADTQTRVDDAATLIALVQSLVCDLAGRYDAGEPLPAHREERIVENAWLATRDGIGGHLIDLETGARVWTAERLHDLADAAAADGDLARAATASCSASAGSSSTAAARRASAASSGAAGSTRCCRRSPSRRASRRRKRRRPGCSATRLQRAPGGRLG